MVQVAPRGRHKTPINKDPQCETLKEDIYFFNWHLISPGKFKTTIPHKSDVFLEFSYEVNQLANKKSP